MGTREEEKVLGLFRVNSLQQTNNVVVRTSTKTRGSEADTEEEQADVQAQHRKWKRHPSDFEEGRGFGGGKKARRNMHADKDRNAQTHRHADRHARHALSNQGSLTTGLSRSTP